MFADIGAFLKLLPLLFSLMKTIEDSIKAAEVETSVADHIKLVQQAFKEQDASILDTAFNGPTQ